MQQIFGRCSGRFRIVVGQEVSDVRGATLSKRAERDLTEILLLLAIHKSIMPHCAAFNCSKDQHEANVSLFRFPINDKKNTLPLASCTKSLQTTTNRIHTGKAAKSTRDFARITSVKKFSLKTSRY